MSLYLAYIRGKFLPLGFEELYACLEAEEINYEIKKKGKQFIIFKTDVVPIQAAQRCAFLHSLVDILAEGNIEEESIKINKEYTMKTVLEKKSFCVRLSKIGEKHVKLATPEIETQLGSFVYTKFKDLDLSVDLKNPEYRFQVLLQENHFFLGLILWSIDREEYKEREPSKRPSFRPGSMKTDFARALVNLSRVKKGDIFLDPFCGGGGFILEAAFLGAFSIGSDIEHEAVLSAEKNLRKYKQGFYSIVKGDSRSIAFRKVQAIATDPPYAIQSSTKGVKFADLIHDFLINARQILNLGRYLVFSCPSKQNPEEIVLNTGFTVETVIDARIHKSLTRRILVLK